MIPRPAQTNPASEADAGSQAVSAGGEAQAPVQLPLDAAAALRKAAEAVHRSILEMKPADHRALLNLGRLARQRGDAPSALGYFKAAMAAKPRRIEPRLEVARELRTLSRLDEAEALYLDLLKKHPTLVRALVGLGSIARARGRHRLALSYYQAAVAAKPSRINLKLEAAAELRKLSRFHEAEQLYRAILTDQPDHARARERLARLPQPEKSGLPPLDRSWLERETFTRAAEWGRNLEALGALAFDMSLLALAQDFARGASEEVRRDCILLRLGKKTKLLPLVSDWEEYEHVLKREATALDSGRLLGPVPAQRKGAQLSAGGIARSKLEFVWHRETVSEMRGSSLKTYRWNIRKLLKAGARVEPIGPENLARVLACNDRWYAEKKAQGRLTHYRTRTAWTLENLAMLEPLGVRHLAVVLDDDVIGYGVGSYLGASWAAYFYGRGDYSDGVAPLLVHEHSKLYSDREWINAGYGGPPGLLAFKQRFTTNAADKQLAMGWIQA
ncbi:tetratricopeptide repeat protein [Microvirga makkahensis]|uniref:Tetratricopeptide repeat protein n=1 Tax=Microvirga makkahensis TaxID=1128670 RepID=A0A7X3SPH4_9HYPH|nr:tetratricopeptide repeat protein [Microvirga makkahensis]MXQ12275.1 tetratricopeptide repeat protein [Microvirga makkahensis]